jgi:transposase InsO family protein
MDVSKLPACPILDYSNWDAFSSKVQSHLAVRKLKKYLTFTIVMSGPSKSSDEDIANSEQTLGFLQVHLSDSVAVQVKNCATAKDCWLALNSMFAAQNQLTKHHLANEFNSLQQNLNESLMDYFGRGHTLLDKVSLFTSFNQEDLVRNLLRGIRPGLRNAADAILIRNEALEYGPTLTTLLGIESNHNSVQDSEAKALAAQAATLQISNSKSGSASGSSSGPNQQSKQKGKGKGRRGKGKDSEKASGESSQKPKCTYCDKPGHSASKCFKRLRDLDKQVTGQAGAASSSNAPPMQSTMQQRPATHFSMVSAMMSNANVQTTMPTAPEEQLWCFDSGATHHMSPFLSDFDSESYQKCEIPIQFGNSKGMAYGIGDVWVRLIYDGVSYKVQIRDVLFVPDLVVRIFSATSAVQYELMTVKWDANECNLYRLPTDTIPLFTAVRINNLMYIKTYTSSAAAKAAYAAKLQNADANMYNVPVNAVGVQSAVSQVHPTPSQHLPVHLPDNSVSSNLVAESISDNAKLWHARFGHLNYDALSKLVDDEMVEGLSCSSQEFKAAKAAVCEPCMIGKSTRQPFPKNAVQSTEPLQLLHMDLCGPMHIPSIGNARYILTIVDDYSRFSIVKFLLHKSDAAQLILDAIVLLQRQTGLQVKSIRSDRGREFLQSVLDRALAAQGILHQTTAPYTPQQNGVAERFNRILLSKVRSMMVDTSVPSPLWAEATNTANVLHNISPTVTGSSTPWELMFGTSRLYPDCVCLAVPHTCTFLRN